MLETAPDAAERERLNAASSENFEAFRLSIGGLVSIGEDDPYASALLDLVDEDPDLNLSQLHNLRHTAPIWRKHIDAALAVDENGPVGLGCEDEDL